MVSLVAYRERLDKSAGRRPQAEVLILAKYCTGEAYAQLVVPDYTEDSQRKCAPDLI